jgi:hypothetical protein
MSQIATALKETIKFADLPPLIQQVEAAIKGAENAGFAHALPRPKLSAADVARPRRDFEDAAFRRDASMQPCRT